MKHEKMEISQNELIAWEDFILGRPVKHTTDILKVSKTQVMNYRKKIRGFMKDDIEVMRLRSRMYAFYPLVVRGLLHHLVNMDKDILIKVAEGLGLLQENHESIKELIAGLAATSGGDVNVTVNNVGGIPANSEEQHQKDRNAATILGTIGQGPRFNQN